MPVDFPAHLYSFVPGRGFGVTPRVTYNKTPATCGTYEPIADHDTPDPARPWARRLDVTIVRLGPTKSGDAWINDEKPGALLIMRGGRADDAVKHGFGVLNLHPLVGFAQRHSNFSKPPIEVGALQVGLALADAWTKNTRVAVEGPLWALDLLAAVPGAIVYETQSSHCEGGHVSAWGRSWKVPDGSSGLGVFDIAARLSGVSPLAHDGSYGSIGSMLFYPDRQAHRRRVVAGSKPSEWEVRSADLGRVMITCDAVGKMSYHEGPIVRWPSSEDPWLVDLVGDGEPIE